MIRLTQPNNPAPVGGIMRRGGAIGLVMCGSVAREVVANRTINADATVAWTARGPARLCSTTTGVYTGRREWPAWEVTGPFSFFAYWQLNTIPASTVNMIGNVGTGVGYAIQSRYGGTGARRYLVGSTGDIESASVWPLGVPISSVITFDGTGMEAWFNSVSEGTDASAAPAYDMFSRVSAGENSEGSGALPGVVWYFGLVNRVLSRAEIVYLARYPFSVYESQRRQAFVGVTAGGGFNAAWNASANTVIQPGAVAA